MAMCSFRKIFPAFFLLLSVACSTAPRFHAEALPGYDACFDRREGWIGGDGVYSVALPGDRVAWLFGDTFIGKVTGNRREDAALVHNSSAVQQGTEWSCSAITFHYSIADGGEPQDLIAPADGRGWLWLLDGLVAGRELHIFMIQIEKTDPASTFGFRVTDSSLGVVQNPEAPPRSWRMRQYRIPFARFSDQGDLLFGSAVLSEEGFVYIYGTQETRANGKHDRHMVLARAPQDAIIDFSAWRFFSNGNWIPDVAKADRLVDGVASEYSVSFLPLQERYALIYTEKGFSRNILMRMAPRPWGPWGDPVVLFQCPEAERRPGIFCYAGKGHPELSQEKSDLIISYIASSDDFEELIQDAALYRPRFIRVTFGR
jgi:hypothetical protein